METDGMAARLEAKRRKAEAIRRADEAIAQVVDKKILSHTLGAIALLLTAALYYFGSPWFGVESSGPLTIFIVFYSFLNAVGAWNTSYRKKKGLFCSEREEAEEVILYLLKHTKS